LITALALGGLLTVLKGGKSVPLDFLNMVSVEKAQAVALGELISQRDRETLKAECRFLLPSSQWDSFGLRQQREAWQALIKFRETAVALIVEISDKLSQVFEFSAFNSFDRQAIEQKLNALNNIINEIKISYTAKQGIQRFIKTWRGSGLSSADISFFKKLVRFLAEHTEQYIFIHHYLHHATVDRTTQF